MRDCFALVSLPVASRRVFVTPATRHPNAAWVGEQAEAFCQHVESAGEKAALVFRDSDTNFTRGFDDTLRARVTAVRRLRPMPPNLNAFTERWIQSIKHECLNHFIVMGEAQSNYLM